MQITIEVSYDQTTFGWNVLYELVNSENGYEWKRLPYSERSFLIMKGQDEEKRNVYRRYRSRSALIQERFKFKKRHLDANNREVYIS